MRSGNWKASTSAYYACIPSKALLRPPEALTEARQVEGARQAVVGKLGIESVFSKRDAFVDNWNDTALTKMMEEGGVHILREHGRLHGRKRVVVTSAYGRSNNSNTTTTLVARHAVVLSTGSSPAIPDVPGLAEAKPWSSRDATSGKQVPKWLNMEDGPVACEMLMLGPLSELK